MKIDKSISEKMNLIKLTNATFDALEVTVDVPEDESKVTITELTEVGTGEDNGENTDIKPNTSVKFSFTDAEEKNFSTTLNFRRLDLAKKMEKDKVQADPSTGHILDFSGVTSNWKVKPATEVKTGLETNAKDVLGVGTDTAVTITVPEWDRSYGKEHSKAKGTVNVDVNVTDSLLVKVSSPIKVVARTRPSNVGEIYSSDGETKAFFSLTEHNSFAEIRDVEDGRPFYGYIDGVIALPYDIETIDGTWWKSRPISNVRFTNYRYPKLKRIEDNALPKAQFQDGDIRFDQYERPDDRMPKGPQDHFLGHLEYIGDNAMSGISMMLSGVQVAEWDSSLETEEHRLKIGNEALYFGKNAFSTSQTVFRQVEVESLQAFLRIIEDGYEADKFYWSSNVENYDELEQKQELDQNDTVGWFVFKNGVKLFVTLEQMTQHTNLFHPEANGTIAWGKLDKYKLPQGFGTSYEANFLRGFVAETLTIGNEETVKNKAFAGSTITNLVFSGDSDTFNVEEGAFDGANITTITVKNDTVKEFISGKLNSLANTPTYKVLEVSAQTGPVEEGEVPETIKADGFKHNEE